MTIDEARRGRYWADATSPELAALDAERAVVVLPVAATEQHGPHLPLSTDTLIVDALMRHALAAHASSCC